MNLPHPSAPHLLYFPEDRASEPASDPRGKSGAAGGLIVLFNGSIIPWSALETNYWWGVSKRREQRKEAGIDAALAHQNSAFPLENF